MEDWLHNGGLRGGNDGDPGIDCAGEGGPQTGIFGDDGTSVALVIVVVVGGNKCDSCIKFRDDDGEGGI